MKPKTPSELFEMALRMRMVEEAIAREYPKAEMKTPVHLYIGEEAIAAGVCSALTKDDQVYAYYRSHGWYLAKGGNLDRMIAELYGKKTGCAGGYGGSMHLIDLKVGFQGTTALVAAAMAHAVGAGFAIQYKNQPHVAITCFGDGATEEGIFQESLMFAELKKLPVIFVCENNGLATITPIRQRQPDVPIYKRAAGTGIHAVQVDGNNAVEVHKVALEAVKRARAGLGPTFMECMTYRPLEHAGPGSDVALGFRTQAEVDGWKAKDPLLQLKKLVDADLEAKLRPSIEKEIERAFAAARAADFPTELMPAGVACL